eukprot:gene31598-36168_t
MSEGAFAASADRTKMNRMRAERRREVARTVQSLREQLAATNGVPPAFRLELLVNHASDQISAAFMKPLMIALMGAAAVLWTNRILIWVWALVAISGHLTSVFFYKRFLSLNPTESAQASWRRRFIFLDGVAGFALGLLFVLPSEPNVATEVFQFSAMLILIAFAAMQTANVPASMIASTLPITVVISAVFIWKAI